MSTRAFLGIHLSTRIYIVFPKFSSRNFVWLKIEQGKVEAGAYASRAVVGLRYRHNWDAV